MIHERPEYVINFVKPKNTEIKYINGHWYLYERTSFYDPKTQKRHKKSGQLLGTITESGFVAKKPKVDSKAYEDIAVVSMGASGYLWSKNSTLLKQLKTYFPDCYQELFAIAILRLVEGPRFKRIEDAYSSSCLSVLMPDLKLDKNNISSLMKSVGKRREAITNMMKCNSDLMSSYIIFDGHRIISDSNTLETAAMGYDSRRRFKNQVNLIYAFSASGEKCFPYYYKQFSGDVPDITAFSGLVDEAGMDKDNLTILADKGFGSTDNFSLIDSLGFKYIIPIKRTNDDSKNNIPNSPAEYDQSFTFQGRGILYKKIKKDEYSVHIYMDTTLFADELGDFTARLEKQNNTIALTKAAEEERRRKGKSRLTDAEFNALQPIDFKDLYAERIGLGTLALRTNDLSINGMQAYYLYKRRQAIEMFFKSYDNSLDFASSYMRDTYSEEAWLFMNHLSSIMAFSIMDDIYEKDKTKDISLEDFISVLSKIYADKVSNEWRCAKITKKKTSFAELFGFDIDAVIKSMNDMAHESSTT